MLRIYVVKLLNTNNYIILFMSKLQAENRIIKKFPERIVHLNELLAMPEFRIAANDIKCKLEIPTVANIKNNVNK